MNTWLGVHRRFWDETDLDVEQLRYWSTRVLALDPWGHSSVGPRSFCEPTVDESLPSVVGGTWITTRPLHDFPDEGDSVRGVDCLVEEAPTPPDVPVQTPSPEVVEAWMDKIARSTWVMDKAAGPYRRSAVDWVEDHRAWFHPARRRTNLPDYAWRVWHPSFFYPGLGDRYRDVGDYLVLDMEGVNAAFSGWSL